MKLSQRNYADDNQRCEVDHELSAIADYVLDDTLISAEAWQTARYTMLDAMGCAMLALNFPECKKLLGPIVPGTITPYGTRVPGTDLIVDPVTATFNIGCLVRWLDYNDTWLAAEWGHPSDNLAPLLAVGDYLDQRRSAEGKPPLLLRDLLIALVKAYEIQGCLALENSFNRLGLDHVLLVKVASTAVITRLLGGDRQQVIDAVSQAWIDGHSLRTYRHAPNTGSRKSWAAGDAAARAVHLAWLTMRGEPGYATALSAPTWGFNAVYQQGRPLKINRAYGCYVMENILFKISFPAEFHAQTAVEAALTLHPQVRERLSTITKIVITTHESAIRIISKQGALHNQADRDHCLQYMTAIALIYGELTAEHYTVDAAADPRIDALRELMVVVEEPRFSRDYLDPDKRSVANALQVFFSDGRSTQQVVVEYPLGHRRRRCEAMPLLRDKLRGNLSTSLPMSQVLDILSLFDQPELLDRMRVQDFMSKFL
jgi:2-methylcitrate dehydratase